MIDTLALAMAMYEAAVHAAVAPPTGMIAISYKAFELLPEQLKQRFVDQAAGFLAHAANWDLAAAEIEITFGES